MSNHNYTQAHKDGCRARATRHHMRKVGDLIKLALKPVSDMTAEELDFHTKATDQNNSQHKYTTYTDWKADHATN